MAAITKIRLHTRCRCAREVFLRRRQQFSRESLTAQLAGRSCLRFAGRGIVPWSGTSGVCHQRHLLAHSAFRCVWDGVATRCLRSFVPSGCLSALAHGSVCVLTSFRTGRVSRLPVPRRRACDLAGEAPFVTSLLLRMLRDLIASGSLCFLFVTLDYTIGS